MKRGRPSKRFAYRDVAHAYCQTASPKSSVRMFTLWITRDAVMRRRLMRAGFRTRQHYLTAHQLGLIKRRWGAPIDTPQSDYHRTATAGQLRQASAALALESLAAIDVPTV